jgi:flavorubredoxin
MVTYEQSEKVFFSADGFGTFGTLDTDADWLDEARRYYINIVGKYGTQVQALLKKTAALDIQSICPLHGPVLKEDIAYYIGKYQVWSSYEPEDDGVVIAYASIHGNTAKAAKQLAEILKEKGAKNVTLFDLARDDMSAAVAAAYRYDRLVLAAASYDAGVFPCMEDFLNHLKAKNFQKRKVAYMQNGSWAPSAGKTMKAIVANLKDITEIEPMVTIKSAVKPENVAEMEALADALLA